MPSIESLISSAPQGFALISRSLNDLLTNDEEKFNSLLLNVVNTSNSNQSEIKHDENFIDDQFTRGFEFIIQSISLANPIPTDQKIATVLESYTMLNRDVIVAIITGYKSKPSNDIDTEQIKSIQVIMSKLILIIKFILFFRLDRIIYKI